ncbi:MAG: hypothetical protein H0X39_13035 [Actinobacteria bacterium]|nr:hypothetical protein [Actinomycetota bacterium]
MLDAFGDSLANQSTADQAVTAATLTYLTGSLISVPAAKLRVGTIFIWRLSLSKTAAGIAARAFHVRVGTLGTTADAAVLTFTQTSLPTAVADDGYIEIVATVRGPLSASCIMQGQHRLMHNGNTAGLAAVPVHVLKATSAAFNATTASLKVGLTVTTGASEALTFQQVNGEAKNL